MPNISVYNESDNRNYTVTVDVFTSVLNTASDPDIDYYIKISTTMRKSSDNSALPVFIARNLSDVPPGFLPATSFKELVDDYIEYYVTQAELGMSSSSSTNSSSSSSESSSSSSSVGYSSSSSSSTSSTSSSSSSSSP